MERSVYRFLRDLQSHVADIREQPPQKVQRRITRILASGEPATLPQERQALLVQRRAAADAVVPRAERHYRPGVPLYPPDDEQG